MCYTLRMLRRIPDHAVHSNDSGDSSHAMLRLMLLLSLVFMLALLMLVVSPLLLLFGAVYDIGLLSPIGAGMRLLGLGLLVTIVPLAGALGLAGLTLDSLSSLLLKRKRKRKRRGVSAREAFLSSLSHGERARLRQKLAEARLTIRDDGTLAHDPRLAERDDDSRYSLDDNS